MTHDIENYPCHLLKLAVLYTQIMLLALSVLLGLILFGQLSDFTLIFKLNSKVVLTGFMIGVFCVAVDLILMKYLPEKAFYDGGINIRLFSCLSPTQILFVTMLIAFSEELLFRGVIQTHFGILTASIVFIAVHVRYLKNIFLFINVAILSFLLGFVYEYTESLWSVIIIHFIIDYILGIYIHYSYKEGV
ncbi:CPBP family intramembrane glutamic endopeptidase [Jeotgalibacillus salarius]|uniref:CPBP family intramembrane metalloprotease n=1 Tax=Jeotgalibacillus salarius TaxID=546023 RepID=A0A4Y8LNU7_9BACL|nr:CPBP family intramembrane glutamic endopeptidase [Jeotgalibacillus salarius]TFE03111.1 CPBP family intramembrane metalloprotease [Jeotgalibacillus salarius]